MLRRGKPGTGCCADRALVSAQASDTPAPYWTTPGAAPGSATAGSVTVGAPRRCEDGCGRIAIVSCRLHSPRGAAPTGVDSAGGYGRSFLPPISTRRMPGRRNHAADTAGLARQPIEPPRKCASR